MSARFSDLKLSIRELSFPFVQEPTEEQCYKKNEQETKRAYDQHVREVECGVLIIRRNGTNSQHGLQRISSIIAQKHDKTYSKTFDCISCKLSYSLLRSAIMCLRGPRSSIHHPTTSPDTMDLASHEGRVLLHWTEPTYIQIKWRYSCISVWL